MGMINTKTLYEFEEERKKNDYIPPNQSNSLIPIGDGEITLHSYITTEPELYMAIHSGVVTIGDHIFTLDSPYEGFEVSENAILEIDNIFCLKIPSYFRGIIHIKENGILSIANGIEIKCYPSAKIIVEKGARIISENDSGISMNGCSIDININAYPAIKNNDNIFIDAATVVTITGIDLGERAYSISDYEQDLRNKIINIHTQGEYNSNTGRISYKWTAGSPLNNSQAIDLSLTWGEMPLGDFKFSVLGIPSEEFPNKQRISNINIAYGTTLYISDNYNGYRYLNPELYLDSLAVYNETTKTYENVNPAKCTISGIVVVSGNNSILTINGAAYVHITETGIVKLINGGIIRNASELGKVNLIIDGTIIMDDIEQIDTFHECNIQFGENGKVIILNPDRADHRILFGTPNGIQSSELYRIFKNTIDHIEYHISNNTGIKIDKYFEYYNRDMTDWFGGRRIEKAIYDKILVWEDGGFIELNSDIIPWVNKDCTLLEASRLFKSYGSTDNDKLEEVVARLSYAGSGSIEFDFVYEKVHKIITLTMNNASVNSIVANTMNDNYTIDSTGNGELYLRSGISSAVTNEIINSQSIIIHVNEGETNFKL